MIKRIQNGLLHNPTMLWGSFPLGLVFTILAYTTLLANIFPPNSNRLYISILFVFLVCSVLIFIALDKVVLPGIRHFSRNESALFLAACFTMGTLFSISIVNYSQTIEWFLPTQSLEISYQGEQGKQSLQWFKTSLREVSFNSLRVDGWERQGGFLIPTDPDNNKITWLGKTAWKATLLVSTSPEGGILSVSWNGKAQQYDLSSATQGTLTIEQSFPVPFFAGPYFMIILIFLGATFLCCLFYLLALRLPPPSIGCQSKKPDWLFYALPMMVVWGVYLLVFFPGLMSPDSFGQWNEFTTFKFTDRSPLFHTLINWLLTRIWLSPASVAIFQILILSLTLGWCISTQRKMGLPNWAAWITSLLLAISPANGVLVITLWKDIPFATTIILVCTIILKITSSSGHYMKNTLHIVLFGLLLACAGLIRLNGILISIPLVPILLLSYRSFWKQILLIALVSFGFYAIIRYPVYTLLRVEPASSSMVNVRLFNLIAAHVDKKAPLSQEETSFIQHIFPGEIPYYCSRNSGLLFSDNLDKDFLYKNNKQLYDLALSLTLRYPLTTINHFACTGAYAYRMFFDYGINETGWVKPIEPNPFQITSNSLIPSLYPAVSRWLINTTEDQRYNWIIWRAPLWMYLMISGCLIFCFRNKNFRHSFILIPIAMICLPMIFLSAGQIFRYVYSIYLAGIVFSGYLWMGYSPSPFSVKKDNHPDGKYRN